MNDDLQAASLQLRVAPPFPVEEPVAEETPLVREEQLVYASVLDGAMKAGLLLLTVTFAVYVAGVLPPHVPVRDLPLYWSMPVKEHLAATGGHAGWAWLRLVHKGDVLNLVGIAFLSGVTLFCYARILPVLIRKRERAYVWISILEVVVLAAAASGVLGAGAH